MNGYPCKNAERGCTAKVLKSKDDGKYHEILDNGTMGARHFCKFWPSKADGKTAQDVLAEQKKLMTPTEEFRQESQKIEQEVANNAAKEKQYSNNDIMNELSVQKIQIAELVAAFKEVKNDYGKAVAILSASRADQLMKK